MRRIITAVLAFAAVLAMASPASAEAADTRGITANCAGWTMVSANYIRLTNGSGTAIGSIQLCKKPHYTGAFEFFSRTEMYAPLGAGRLASGYVYYDNVYSGTREFRSCDMNTGSIGQGETLCYTSNILDDRYASRYQGIARVWYSSGGKWVLYAEGATAVIEGA